MLQKRWQYWIVWFHTFEHSSSCWSRNKIILSQIISSSGISNSRKWWLVRSSSLCRMRPLLRKLSKWSKSPTPSSYPSSLSSTIGLPDSSYTNTPTTIRTKATQNRGRGIILWTTMERIAASTTWRWSFFEYGKVRDRELKIKTRTTGFTYMFLLTSIIS